MKEKRFYWREYGFAVELRLLWTDNLYKNNQPDLYCPELDALAVSFPKFSDIKNDLSDVLKARDKAKKVSPPTFRFFTTDGNFIFFNKNQ